MQTVTSHLQVFSKNICSSAALAEDLFFILSAVFLQSRLNISIITSFSVCGFNIFVLNEAR